MLFDDLWLKMKGFLTSQPLKSTANTLIFMRFRIFSVFMIWMVSGTTLDTILLSFGGLREPFWWFWEVLEIAWNSMNSSVSSETPRLQSTQSGGGKMLIPRAHYYRQLGGYSIQNTTYSMKQCHTGSKDVNVTCKCQCKWCMKQYSPQPGGPWQAGAGGFSILDAQETFVQKTKKRPTKSAAFGDRLLRLFWGLNYRCFLGIQDKKYR